MATGAVEAVGAIEAAGAALCRDSGVGSGTGTGLVVAGAGADVEPLELVDDDDVVEDVEFVEDELEVLVDDEPGDVVVAVVAGAVGAAVVDGLVTGAVAVDEAPLVDFNVSEPAPPLNTTGIVDCSDTA